jgi:hypothetical protein
MDDNLHVCTIKCSCSALETLRVLTGASENEMRAINELPIGKLEDVGDLSPVGHRIQDILTKFDQNRDVSLLEEAGRLIWQQIFEPHRSKEVKEPSIYQRYKGPSTQPSQAASRIAKLQNINAGKVSSLACKALVSIGDADF